METSVILEFLQYTLMVCIAGILVGGGLGVLCALLARPIFFVLPKLYRLSMLLPWRTVLFGLLLILWSPFITIIWGLGITRGAEIAGLSMALLAWAFTIGAFFVQWYPSSLSVRLIAVGRTLATASGTIVALMGLYNGWGIGYFVQQRMNQAFQPGIAWQGLLTVVALALAMDLLLGTIQVIVSARQKQSSPIQTSISFAQRLFRMAVGKRR